VSENEEEGLNHICEIIFRSSRIMDGVISYEVSVNGFEVCGAWGIKPDEISPTELTKHMGKFDSDLHAVVCVAAAAAFRRAAADGFVPAKGKFRGELKVTFPGEKGRPRKWTRAKLEQVIRRAISSYRKRKYRSPTLEQAANEINMPVANLKKLMLRYGLRYSTYKKET
jgi:hypothetical protein